MARGSPSGNSRAAWQRRRPTAVSTWPRQVRAIAWVGFLRLPRYLTMCSRVGGYVLLLFAAAANGAYADITVSVRMEPGGGAHASTSRRPPRRDERLLRTPGELAPGTGRHGQPGGVGDRPGAGRGPGQRLGVARGPERDRRAARTRAGTPTIASGRAVRGAARPAGPRAPPARVPPRAPPPKARERPARPAARTGSRIAGAYIAAVDASVTRTLADGPMVAHSAEAAAISPP